MSLKKQILVIEKNDRHYELLRQVLADSRSRLTLTRTDDTDKAKRLLAGHRYDLVVTENLGLDLNGEWLTDLKRSTHGTPLIILTSLSDERKAVSAMKMGADDYIIKNRDSLSQLPQVIERSLKKRKTVEELPSKTPLWGLNPRYGGMNLLARNLKTIVEMMNQPAQTFVRGKKQLQMIEHEIDRLKGVIKNLVS